MDAPVEFVKKLLPTVVNIHATVPRQHPSTRIHVVAILISAGKGFDN